MSDVACGVHALDVIVHPECKNCLKARLRASDAEIKRLRSVEAAHLASSAEDADRIADLETRLDTSLEVICSREQHVEAQRVEIERLRAEALALRGVIASDDNRLLTAARRVDLDFGCDSAEAMADKVVWLRTENARLRGEYVAAASRLDEARLLAGALLDRVMEVEEILGCRKDKWKSSLVAKWPWLEGAVEAGGGDATSVISRPNT